MAEPPGKLSLVLLVGSERCGHRHCSSVLVAPVSSTECPSSVGMADTKLCPCGWWQCAELCPDVVLSCICSWLSLELAQTALESCVKRNWALKSSGKDTSSPLSLPCACLCPVHSLHKDGLPPHTFLWMEGFSFSPLHLEKEWLACPLLPPSTLSPVGEAVTSMWLLSLPFAAGHPPGQGDADRTGGHGAGQWHQK